MPVITLHSHQDEVFVDLAQQQCWAEVALPLCLAAPSSDEPMVLSELAEVEISFISDAAIQQVHADFLNDPTATDVITFHHGEILISAETARRQAAAYGESLERELARYVIHGLLHLNGHTDLKEPARQQMHQIQERIVEAVTNEGEG